MKRIVCWITLLLPVIAYAQRQDRHGRNWRVEDKENIQRTFNLSAGSGPQKLLVDNISGYIHVTGYAGREIQLKAVKQIGADSNEALAQAKRDVKLDISQQGNFVRLYVDGPSVQATVRTIAATTSTAIGSISTTTFKFRSRPSWCSKL